MDRFLEAPLVVFRVGGIPITETVFISWVIMAVMISGGYVLTQRLRRSPTGVQSVLELLIKGLTSLVTMTMGRDKLGFLGYVGSLTLFILVSNVLGVTGLRPPTSDINVTMGLALLTFLATQYYRFTFRGFGGYVKSYAEPVVFIFPLNVISELAAPVSLGMRLFGNILGGSIIVAMIYSVVPLAVPLPFHLYFDLFVGAVQAFIFVMLTMVFIKMAIE